MKKAKYILTTNFLDKELGIKIFHENVGPFLFVFNISLYFEAGLDTDNIVHLSFICLLCSSQFKF